MAAVHNQLGGIERRVEKPLVAVELQFVRHHPIGIGEHAVGRHDDVALDAQIRHWEVGDYSETVVTTLLTGRWLSVGSFASFSSSSSYCGRLSTGALARIATTL